MNGELLPLDGEDGALLCQPRDMDNISGLDLARVDLLPDFRGRGMSLRHIGFGQTLARFLDRLAALFHAVIIKLLLELFDCLFRAPPRLAYNAVRLFARLV